MFGYSIDDHAIITRKWTKMTEGVNIDLAGDVIKGKVETKDNKWGSADTHCND